MRRFCRLRINRFRQGTRRFLLHAGPIHARDFVPQGPVGCLYREETLGDFANCWARHGYFLHQPHWGGFWPFDDPNVHMELEAIRKGLDRDIEIAQFMAEQEAWTFMQDYLKPRPTDPPAQPPETQPPTASEQPPESQKDQDEKPAT